VISTATKQRYGDRMHDFAIDRLANPEDFYAELLGAADALTRDEPDAIANMANLAALVWQLVPDLNWAGFYRRIADELVLGPFCGKPACIRIPLGLGVCGAAAATGETQRVPDVHAFPGHIACDAASRSELVVPVFNASRVIAVLDLDSPIAARFSAADQTGFEQLAALIAPRISRPEQA